MILSASKKFRKRLVTRTSCLKSRWNISTHSNLYHKTNTAQRIYFELKWSLIFMFLIILYLSPRRHTTRKNSPCNCIRNSSENPIQLPKKSFAIILPSRNLVNKRMIQRTTEYRPLTEPAQFIGMSSYNLML